MRVRVEFTIRILPEHVRAALKHAQAITAEELREFINNEAAEYVSEYFSDNGVPNTIMTTKF